jgi:long-chain fatty acid transport protein
MKRRTAFIVGALALTAPSVTRAGGFETEYPDNGGRALGRAGAFTARADDPTAVYYNPAGLTKLEGEHLLVSANVLSLDHTFSPADRTATRGARRITLEFADVEQQVSAFVAPFLAWQFDVDTLPALDFGLALYGPAANGHRKFADQLRPVRATDARGEDATRFVAGARADTLVPNGMLVESELAQIFPTAAVAWRVRPDLSLGVSLQNSVVIARLVQGAGGAFPGQAELNVMDLFSPTAILGAQWRPFDALELGLAARPPVQVEAHGTAKLRRYADCQQPSESGCAGAPPGEFGQRWPLAGPLPLVEADGRTQNEDATLRFTNPAWVRAGVRWVQPRWDLELDYIFEGNSVHEAYTIDFAAPQVNLPAETGPGTLIPMTDLRDLRRYVDTHALRLGGDLVVLPGRLTVRAGAAYETGASPEAYTHLDFPGLDQLTGSMGLGAQFGLVDVDLGAAYVVGLRRDVRESQVRLTDLQRPAATWDINGQGAFEARYMVLGVSTSWRL